MINSSVTRFQLAVPIIIDYFKRILKFDFAGFCFCCIGNTLKWEGNCLLLSISMGINQG